MNTLIVVDLEATCWLGHPPEGQKSEIIQFGIAKVDMDLLTVRRCASIYVTPERSTVSEFCTELTGVTKEVLDREGVPFERAINLISTMHQPEWYKWGSWGDYDRRMIKEECLDRGVENPFVECPWLNLRDMFGFKFKMGKGPGMDKALEFLGMELEGRHHDGGDDAWNIGRLVVEMLRRA